MDVELIDGEIVGALDKSVEPPGVVALVISVAEHDAGMLSTTINVALTYMP